MKKILITGVSSGFGEATAHYLHTKGYSVIGTSRSPDKIAAPYKVVKLDVTNPEQIRTVVQKIDGIDILMNNAGYALAGPAESTTYEEAKNQMDTNFYGPVELIKQVLPGMRERGGGLIVNISSIGGLMGLPFQSQYCASKFALEGFTEAIRMELKPFNIDVVNINPGDFKTGITANRLITKSMSDTYLSKFNKALKNFEKDEQNGSDPELVVKKIEKLISGTSRPKVRYLVGQPVQKLAVYLKRWLGSRIFEKILRINYQQ